MCLLFVCPCDLSIVFVAHCPSCSLVFFLMIRRPPRSTLDRSSAASDVYKRQVAHLLIGRRGVGEVGVVGHEADDRRTCGDGVQRLSLIHISEPTRPY